MGATSRAALAVLFGVLGGAVFALLHLPLPWLLGSLTASLIAALCGVPVAVDKRLRKGLVVVIGLMLGGTFTPDILERVSDWVPTLIAAGGYLIVVTLLAQLYCRFMMKMDPLTAVFSGMPGGLSEMTILGEEQGADVRALTLTHAVRVASVLLFIPFFLTYGLAIDPVSESAIQAYWRIADVGILSLTAAAGVLVATVVRLPAGALTGPLLFSAAVHLAGIVDTEPPETVAIIVQIAMGSALGARFHGLSVAEVGRTMTLAVGLAFAMMAVTFATAGMLSAATGISFEALVLALSPGGFAEMALAARSIRRS